MAEKVDGRLCDYGSSMDVCFRVFILCFGRFNGVRNLDFCEQRPGLLGMFVIRFFQSRIKCLFFLS